MSNIARGVVVIALAMGAAVSASAGTTVWISGPGDRHQTIIIHDIKKPAALSYVFEGETGEPLAGMEAFGDLPFDHTGVIGFSFTDFANALLEDPVSHLPVLFVGSAGLAVDDGTGRLVGTEPHVMTTFEFVFPTAPGMGGSIMFASIPAPSALSMMGVSTVLLSRRRR